LCNGRCVWEEGPADEDVAGVMVAEVCLFSEPAPQPGKKG
jgi:hypothetical protein